MDKLDMSLDELCGSEGSYGKSPSMPQRERPARAQPYGEGGSRERAGAGGGGNRRVFVGNLAYSVKWTDLKDHMRLAGDVLRCDILEEPGTTLGSKGCGIVEFATAADARRAIKELSETELKGRTIYLREDRDFPQPGGRPARLRAPLEELSDTVRRIFEAVGAGAADAFGGRGSGCKLFVGNLPYSATWKDLKDHMRAAGEVLRADIFEDPDTPCGSKGCGIVMYASRREAQRAIKLLGESELKGRKIYVREDVHELSADTWGAAAHSGSRGESGSGCRVFVGNLPYSVTWQTLKDHMKIVGDVRHCEIVTDPGTALGSKGCAVVEYFRLQDARKAIEKLTETRLAGRSIFVRAERF